MMWAFITSKMGAVVSFVLTAVLVSGLAYAGYMQYINLKAQNAAQKAEIHDLTSTVDYLQQIQTKVANVPVVHGSSDAVDLMRKYLDTRKK